MKKIILYIATSSDGFIAAPYDDLDWLINFPNPTNEDYGYRALLDQTDTLVMGGRTFRWLLNQEIAWEYGDMDCYVVSRAEIPNWVGVKFITRHIPETILELKHRTGKDIWLMGGGILNTLLLDHDLIDEVRLTMMPVELKEGFPLFTREWDKTVWEATDRKAYKNGVMQTTYRRKRG